MPVAMLTTKNRRASGAACPDEPDGVRLVSCAWRAAVLSLSLVALTAAGSRQRFVGAGHRAGHMRKMNFEYKMFIDLNS